MQARTTIMNKVNKISYTTLIVIISTILIQSCIFLNPFYDDKTLISVDYLIGHWNDAPTGNRRGDSIRKAHFRETDGNTIKKTGNNQYEIRRREGNNWTDYRLRAFKLENQIYFDTQQIYRKDSQRSKDTVLFHDICKFKQTNDSTIKLICLNYEKVSKGIKTGKIALKLKGNTEKDLYVISSTKDQQTFLKFINNKPEYWDLELTYIKRKIK